MSTTKITNEEWVGVPGRAMKTYHLRAGNLDALFDGGRLCQICYGGIPVIDEVYYALRDCNWGTIPFEIHGFSIEQSEQEFEVKFKGIHCSKDIHYTFLARISGSRESTIEYSFEGTAHSSFLRNRIGFCVLHPASCAGNRCIIEHKDAKVESGVFPVQIAPHQPFCNIKAITHFPAENLMAKTEMTGDIFEMEDQRNWTDASFKTYCTPLKEPFPVMVQQGDKVQQTIRISLKEIGGKASSVKKAAKAEIVEEVNCPTFSLGCMIDKPLTEGQLALVNLLHLGHLLFDYHFTREDAREQLKIICCQAKKLNCPLRIRAFFSDAWRNEVEHFNAELRGAGIQDISVFFENAAVIKEDMKTRILDWP